MDFTVILIFVVLSAITALMMIFVFRKRSAAGLEDASSDYAEGLNLLLAGDTEKALKKFKEAVTKNSQNIDAYLKIGDILRESGQFDRAVNVHKYLTVRTTLTAKQKREIYQSLVMDYQAAQEYDKAFDVLGKIISEDKNNTWAHEMKLKLYEQKEEWEDAFQVYKSLKKGEIEKAVNLCSSILESDPSNKAAKKYLIRLYHHTGQKDEALNLAIELIEASSKHKEKFRCSKCRHESDKPFWRCPGCFEWETAIQN